MTQFECEWFNIYIILIYIYIIEHAIEFQIFERKKFKWLIININSILRVEVCNL